MKYFTKAQIDEIRRALATSSVKDTDLEETSTIESDDCVAIVQDGTNKKISVDAFRNELQNGPKGNPGRGIVSVSSQETAEHDIMVIFNFSDNTASQITIPIGQYLPSQDL